MVWVNAFLLFAYFPLEYSFRKQHKTLNLNLMAFLEASVAEIYSASVVDNATIL